MILPFVGIWLKLLFKISFSTAEFQNEGFLHGTSQQLLPLIQPNVNNVTQKTSAPSNFTCVTNIPYKGSLFQKEQRTILPAFESSDQDEEG